MRWTWSPVPPWSPDGHKGGGGARRNSSGQRSADVSRRERPHTPRTRYAWYQIRCHTEQGPVTQRHTLGTTFVRLSTKGNLPTGSKELCHCHHMWEKFQGHLEKVQRAILRVVRSPGFNSQAQKTTARLLREWVLLTLNRAWEGGTFLQTVIVVLEVLVTLTRTDLAEEEYDPYDGVERPPGKQDPPIGEKSLGTASCVPVPSDICDKHAPVSLDWALRVLPDQGHRRDSGLHALAGGVARDGLLGVKPDPCPSQFRVFAKSRNATKGALLGDLPELTSLLPKPLPFKLPSLRQLDSLFSLCKSLKLKLFFTKLDRSNMYGACKPPPEWSGRITFRVNGVSYVVHSLPFWWAHSPIIAIENLARFLILTHPGQVILIQYLDDVLLLSTDANVLRWDTKQLVPDLVEGGWVVSPKSVVEPSTSITWMGKSINGESYEIQ